MKKVVFFLATVALAACSESGPSTTDGTGGGNCVASTGADECFAEEKMLKRCSGELLERCDGCYWIAGEDCTTLRDGWVCNDLGAGVASCGAPMAGHGEFSECGINIASCPPDLTCSGLADSAGCVCLRPCAADPSICDLTTEFCNTLDFTEGACTPRGGTLAPCTGPTQCIEGITCLAPNNSTAKTCVRDCNASADECDVSEYCDKSGRYPVDACLPRLAEGEVCSESARNCEVGIACLDIANRGRICVRLCDVDPNVCEMDQYCADTLTIPVCLPRIGEFELCSGPDCGVGMLCSGRTGGADVCVRPCEINPLSCIAGEYCDTSGVFDISPCLPVVRESDACGDGLAQCGAGLTCLNGPAGDVCMRACDTSPDVCRGNELCDRSGVFSVDACIPIVDEWRDCGPGVAECGVNLTCSGGPDGQVCVRRCVDNPSICVAGEICDTSGAYSESACIPVVGELEACGDGLAGCFFGLTCSPAAGANDLCANNCVVDSSACDSTTEYCDTRLVTAGTCLVTGADRDELCAAPDGCDAAFTCMATNDGNMSCRLACSGADVGEQGTCPSGEGCLAIDEIEFQPDDASCDPADDPTTCDSANKFECTARVNPFNGEVTYVCTRPEGLCGTEAALLTSLTRDDLGSVGPENSCGLASQSVFCPDLGPEGAQVECSDTPFANPDAWGPRIPCEDASDCLIVGGEMIADADCIDFGGATGSVCAVASKVCIAFCEDEDGNELTCPDDLVCQVPHPPHQGFGFAVFLGGGIFCNEQGCFIGIECTSSANCSDGAGCIDGLCLTSCSGDLDCGSDYYCDEPFTGFGPICTRTPKVCMDAGQQSLQCR